MREHIGYTKEAIITAEQKLTREKLALTNFGMDIHHWTMHTCTYFRKILAAGFQITDQHFILVFMTLKEAPKEEFKSIIMKLSEGWHTGKGEGADITIINLLAHADSEFKRLVQVGEWTTQNSKTELIGLQAKFDALNLQMCALVADCSEAPPYQPQDRASSKPSNKPTDEPK